MITFDVSPKKRSNKPAWTVSAEEALRQRLTGNSYDSHEEEQPALSELGVERAKRASASAGRRPERSGGPESLAPKAPSGPSARRVFEGYALRASRLVPTQVNGFVYAAELAFCGHWPLVFGPDELWHVLAGGLAQHINLHAEELRERLVAHEGKIALEVQRDDFWPGRDNPWDEAIDELVELLREHAGKRADLLLANFSTTGPIERVVSHITTMDALQHYFDYSVLSLCGIPEITLLGSVDDWLGIRQRAAAFAEYSVSSGEDNDAWGAWVEELLPILDDLVATAKGKPRQKFWRSFVKVDSESGDTWLNGWIASLFPYLVIDETPRPNTFLGSWRHDQPRGPNTGAFPNGLSMAPLLWRLPPLGEEREMQLLGGFMGVSQEAKSLALRPELGWAVREVSVE